jgi:hypothetical protein
MNKRIGDLEFRYIPSKAPFASKWEIVKWENHEEKEGEYCYTLVLYDMHNEGFDIQFVGSRPFEYENKDKLWDLMKFGQSVLEALFELEDDWK